jgi:hypothetical protein
MTRALASDMKGVAADLAHHNKAQVGWRNDLREGIQRLQSSAVALCPAATRATGTEVIPDAARLVEANLPLDEFR